MYAMSEQIWKDVSRVFFLLICLFKEDFNLCLFLGCTMSPQRLPGNASTCTRSLRSSGTALLAMCQGLRSLSVGEAKRPSFT